MKARPAILILLVLLCIGAGSVHGQKRITQAKHAGERFEEEVDHSRDHFISKADFRDAEFDSMALFRYARFDSEVLFTSAYFNSGAYFGGGRFYSNAHFGDAHFYGEADFLEASFDSFTDFYHTHFDSQASFSFVPFGSMGYFPGAHFVGEAFFTRARFKSMAHFSDARFDSLAYFYGTTFDTLVWFKLDSFMTEANFSHANFRSTADFHSAYFKRKLSMADLVTNNNTRFDFSRVVLPDTINLSYNPYLFFQLPLAIDFTSCNFSADSVKKRDDNTLWQKIKNAVGWYFFPSDTAYELPVKHHLINLYNTDISKVKIDYTHFRLYFKDENEDIEAIVALSDDVKKSMYEQLLKNFKDHGQMASYELLELEYHWFNGRRNPGLTGIVDWWWRFGYERWRVFIHALLFIFLFSLYNFFRIHKLNEEQYGVYHIALIPDTLYTRSENNKGPRWLLRRAWAAVAYTSVLFFLLTLKVDKIRFSNVRASMWILFIYSVGLLCLGYMANFVLQK